ncbi:MAG: glycoside hydrolase family 2 [Bacteroidetes bacterium]|nr:glycoside hydrolase family 2 [Bacteroidota bacterium]
MILEAYAQTNSYPIKTYTNIDYKDLQDGFLKTPDESGLRCYWWWLNSMVTEESITRDLEQMKARGYGGASLFDAGSSSYKVARKTAAGPVFMSHQWMELYKHAVREAERIGIELSVNVQSGWNPGAPTITPEFAMKKIVFSETNVTGGQVIQLELPQPPVILLYRDVLVQAVKNMESPVQNDAILNWDKKSFNKSLGWKGILPLHELSESYSEKIPVTPLQKNEIFDLTDNYKDGVLNWDAPSGEWTILRYGYTCTGAKVSTPSDGWGGLSVDHLSPRAFELFSNTVIQPLIKTAQEAGNSIRFLQTDSWEMGVVNWTNNFPQEFKKFRGYDLKNYMPVLTGRVVESREVTNRFLHDLRHTVSDCVVENHYQLFYNLAHKNGLGIHPESGGPHSAPVDALRVMGISDFPMGEFWARSNTHRVSDAERLSVKQSASVAHTNGKRFIAAEGPTSIGPQWERSPKDLKGNIDRIFCAGVNRITWHTFTSSPKEFGLPGNEYFAGTHLNPNVTWWEQAGDFISYMNRCSFMLQQGLFVADVLYYYGDGVPNFIFLKDEYKELKRGYNWDKCSKDILLNRVSVENGKLVLPDGMTYRVLVLPDEKAINLEVLKKVEKLVMQGLTVIAPRPRKATGLTNYPESDSEIEAIAKRMWSNVDGENITENEYGKGRVVWGQDINEVLAGIGVHPDLEFISTNEKTALDFIHRTTDNQEIYFVVNRYARKGINDFEYRYLTDLPDRYEQVECKFRVTGKVPELWNPMTGEIRKIYTYQEEGGYIIVPLHFEPEGSKFIIFREAEKDESHITHITKDGRSFFPENQFETKSNPYIEIVGKDSQLRAHVTEPGEYELTWSDGKTVRVSGKGSQDIVIKGSWEINFDPKWGGIEKVSVDELKSWTEFTDEGIKYYSGAATYNTTFSLNKKEIKNKKLLLDLGNVQEMASIKVNGQQMPVRWSAPFVFDITKYAKAGTNYLEVEVVNMWSNRLILDGRLSEEKRLTKTNINKFDAEDAEKYLRASGLSGPIKLRKIADKRLKK